MKPLLKKCSDFPAFECFFDILFASEFRSTFYIDVFEIYKLISIRKICFVHTFCKKITKNDNSDCKLEDEFKQETKYTAIIRF